MHIPEPYFTEIDPTILSDQTIILDIDGTLGYDGATVIDHATRTMVARLAQRNKVYLLSNKPLPDRNKAFAELLAVPYLHSPYKKPHAKIVESLAEQERGNIVVIGDKYITDGLFAKRIHARFIKVRRIRAKNEGLKAKAAYAIDNIVYSVLHFLHVL
ncbi:MAG: hypothetical protein JWM92_538 [Candidatus Nomurabacteria bacterium]|nr:hypothetical protein [Candidatus Nomurabacteria bacterium]